MQLATRFARSSNQLRSDSALTEDQLQSVAPSLFAAGAHCSRSERYTYIPTIQVLRGLQREGFQPFFAMQSRCRIEGRTPFTKHMLRLRHTSQYDRGVLKVGDVVPEVVLINSHDGTSSYQMAAGLFRKVCSNGMMVEDSCVGDVRVPHKGDVQDRVIQGAFEVLDGFTRVVDKAGEMKAVALSRPEQEVFAAAALELRYGDPAHPAPVTPEQVNTPRRWQDRGDDLFLSFQRVQENLTRGGQQGRTVQGRNTTTRPVQSIDSDTKLNRALWVLTERMRALKTGEPLAA